ncbi:MAG: valine--tRNA ligase [Niabella sp.]|nr:MAG: valine--tRNA ligase [Niabella sp.]
MKNLKNTLGRFTVSVARISSNNAIISVIERHMDKVFDHKNSESKIYESWEQSGFFKPENSLKLHGPKGTYSILMPPPNANAALHCGHATYSIQDLMIRFKRMQGYETVYFPGTDHAGFETQVVYERNLKADGKSRFDFDRETFYNNVLNFVKDNSMVAVNQLKRIGMSCDWDRLTFTLDPQVVDFVLDTFIRMNKDGMVYRDGYMVNYSTFHGTTFSDLETDYKDTVSPLYYVKYTFADDSSRFITVATVRPETIYADVAIAVNPKDSRYKDVVGKKVINPLTGVEIPIIADDYVEIEFGTGALKITPAHDFNDYKIGKKHNLPLISLINLDGRMNENAKDVQGMFPKEARVKTAEILQFSNHIEKIDEKYQNRVLVDYKDGFPIEPMLLPNWFIKIDVVADMAIQAIEDEEVKFNLPEWKRDILYWVKEKKPWPISRQTIFGIRIPVWYSVDENPAMVVSFLNKDKRLVNGKISELLNTYDLDEIKSGLQRIFADTNAKFEVSKNAPSSKHLQETDTFDTWFSSGQWPFVTMLKNPSDKEKYFPTSFLDSGYDIMFFWITRMIMFSKYLSGGLVPFKNVYFHGMVTDKNGKKMSKSKGNVINPMDMIEKYGSDALRMSLIVGGNTEARISPFDEEKVRGYRNFANKIWNMGRFIELKRADFEDYKTQFKDFDIKKVQAPSDEKLLNELNSLVEKTTEYLENFKFKYAGEALYHFIWDDLANNYLESIKNRTDINALLTLDYTFKTSLKLLHPYMPFITESVWQELYSEIHINCEHPMLILSEWPKPHNG